MTHPIAKKREPARKEPSNRSYPKTVTTRSSGYQPSKAELEADVSIPTTPDELLKAVINYNPKKEN